MKMPVILCFVCMMVFLSGCGGDYNVVLEENKQLNDTNVDLSREVEKLRAENSGLEEQLVNLAGVDPNIRLENIVTVNSIKIAGRTGFFDKDYDGVKEKLIVYLKTIDEFGDAIKGAGSVDVQLWDLNSEGEDAKLGRWEISAQQLKLDWASTMLTNYYRLVFDVSNIDIASRKNLTVKVKFVDYLTGRVFEEQVVIEQDPKQSSSISRRQPVTLGSLRASRENL